MISLIERVSLKNIAPEETVNIGARNFNTTASNKERHFREKCIPERAMDLR
jgi:hypothetical protein